MSWFDRDEFEVQNDPCLWCNEPLGRYSTQPREGKWVHRVCDELARDQNLGRYLDLLEED